MLRVVGVALGACLSLLWQEGQDPVGRLAGLRRGANNGSIVLAQAFKPGTDIVGVAHGRHDSERCAAKGRNQLGCNFFDRIELGAEGTGQVSVQAAGRSAGVTDFVQRRAVPVDGFEVGVWRWDLHVVEGRDVIGPVAADAEVDVGGLDQRLDLRLDQARRWWRRLDSDVLGQTLALRSIEDREPLEERDRVGVLARVAGALPFVVGNEVVGIDDGRAVTAVSAPHFLALFDLRRAFHGWMKEFPHGANGGVSHP